MATKIYTKTGDTGMTHLYGSSKKVPKTHPQIIAVGSLDELNANIGLLTATIFEEFNSVEEYSGLALFLHEVQNKLFVIGSFLGTSPTSFGEVIIPNITDSDIEQIEKHIDDIQKSLPELKSFVIPYGCISTCRAHIVRSVCRQAERSIIDVCEYHGLMNYDKGIINKDFDLFVRYLNRLSDYFFVLSRWIQLDLAKGGEVRWEPRKSKKEKESEPYKSGKMRFSQTLKDWVRVDGDPKNSKVIYETIAIRESTVANDNGKITL